MRVNQGQLQLAAVVMGLAMPAALLWLSGHFRTLTRAEGGTPGLALAALGGGILTAASSVVGALVLGTTATRVTDLGPAGARVWWTMHLLSTGATLLGLLLLIGATAAVCLQRQLFAQWFAVASVVLALASMIGAFTIGYDTAGIQVVAGIAICSTPSGSSWSASSCGVTPQSHDPRRDDEPLRWPASADHQPAQRPVGQGHCSDPEDAQHATGDDGEGRRGHAGQQPSAEVADIRAGDTDDVLDGTDPTAM